MTPVVGPDGCGGDAAPYVLGALDPSEARAFCRHLERCAVCSDEVAALAPVVEVLPMSAPHYEVPAAVRARVMRAVRAEPRSAAGRPRAWTLPLRPRLARPALAGWVAVVLAIAIGYVELGPAGSPERVIRAGAGRAELRVAGGHGELIVAHLPPPPPGQIYEMWLQHGDHTPVPGALFGVSPQGTAEIGVPGDLNGVSRLLVTVEPAGGSRVPTTRSVIVAPVT